MKRLLFLALALPTPALAQISVNTNGTVTPQALCVVQLDGTCSPITVANPLPTSGGGGGSVPTGTAGNPNAAVVSVQGVNGGTPQTVSINQGTPGTTNGVVVNSGTVTANLGTIAGVSTAANQSSQITAEQAIQTNQTNDAQTTISKCTVDTVGAAASANLAKYSCLMDAYHGIRMYLGVAGSSGIIDARAPADGQGGTVGLVSTTQNELWNGTTWVMARGDATGTWAGGHANLLTGQVAVSATTATLIAAARAGRQSVTVEVTSAVQCAYGPAGITGTTGFPLAPTAYAAQTIPTAAAVYAFCASAATVAYSEQY